MKIDKNGIIFYGSGDTHFVPLKILNPTTKQPIDLTNIDIFFSVKDKKGNEIFFKSTVNAQIQKLDQVTNKGKARVYFSPRDTFNSDGSYNYDIECRVSNGAGGVGVATPIKSIFNIVKDFANG